MRPGSRLAPGLEPKHPEGRCTSCRRWQAGATLAPRAWFPQGDGCRELAAAGLAFMVRLRLDDKLGDDGIVPFEALAGGVHDRQPR